MYQDIMPDRVLAGKVVTPGKPGGWAGDFL